MQEATTEWTCAKCTALNPLVSRTCWNCKMLRPELPHTQRVDEESQTNASIRDMLVRHLGEHVDINYQNPSKTERALLSAVHQDYFTVSPIGSNAKFHYPFRFVLCVVEDGDVDTTNLLIEVYRQVFVKGSIGFGYSVPM